MATFRFHVFSGTGNSMHLARSLAARIGAAMPIQAEYVEVSSGEIRRLRRGETRYPPRVEGDLDLFLFPVFAMSVPRIVKRYVRALGRAAGPGGAGGAKPRAAVLSTNGRISDRVRDGHEGDSLAQADRMLRRRGWDLVCRDTFDYPQSIASILKIQDEERKAAIMALVEPRIDELAARLASGERHRRPCRAWAHLVGWPFGWLYSIFGRRMLAMLYAPDASCDGCGLCAKRCPAGAIRMIGGVPDWSYACEGCERCINICPKRAIQTSLFRIGIVAAIFAAADLCPLKGALAAALAALPTWCFEAIWFAASVVLGFAALRLADLALAIVSRIRPLRPVLAFGWTKWTGRYRAPRRASE
jgi:ferredoxin